MLSNFLMGHAEDNFTDAMYPLVFIEEITKDDLLRCKRDNIIIIDLDKHRFFNPNKNEWEPMKKFRNFKDQWR